MPKVAATPGASSRASSTSSLRRSRRNDATISEEMVTLPAVKRRRTGTSLAVLSSTADLEVQDSEADLASSPAIDRSVKIEVQIKSKAPLSRASLSSVSTANDDIESSGYTTPGTSTAPTPAPAIKEETITQELVEQKPVVMARRRGRPSSTAPAVVTPSAGERAFQRAKMLRNSEYAMNASSSKRKRETSQFDIEDEVCDVDDTADAQLAKALQEQEDAKVHTMASVGSEDELTPRRTRRAYRAIRPKADFVSDFSDEDVDSEQDEGDRKGKGKAKLVYSRTKTTKVEVLNSEESDFDGSIDDQESIAESDISSDFVPLAADAEHDVSVAKNSARSPYFKAPQTATPRRGQNSTGGRKRNNGSSTKKTSNLGVGTTAVGSIDLWDERADDSSELSDLALDRMLAADSEEEQMYYDDEDEEDDDDNDLATGDPSTLSSRPHVGRRQRQLENRAQATRARLEFNHPELLTMWEDLKNLPEIKATKAVQPVNINRELKPFQLEGLNWMQQMEKSEWGGGLLGDEMGMGKTIQAVSLIMSDYPAKTPSLVLIPPVALMQWQQEINDYTDGTLKTFVYHGTNLKTKDVTVKDLSKYDVILMSYNSLESMWRHQEKGRKRKTDGVERLHFHKSVIHQIQFHRVILDEAHNIKQRTTGVAKACFALKADHKWCLSGTPLQNRIGEFFSLIRFLDIRPFACYFCKQCPCSTLEWSMNSHNRCTQCNHSGMQHVSVFNQELLNPIQKCGNKGAGKIAFGKLRLLTDRFMLRRVKRDHSSAMELPAKEIYVDRQFFGEEENDFAGSIMNNSNRKFETYVAQGVLLNNYANIFGLIMQMRQVADHPDLILKKNSEGGQNVLVCCICDEPAEDAIRSGCKHDFCRTCVKSYIISSEESGSVPDCPRCHIPLTIDLEQPEMEQDEQQVKKSSIINRIKMENWTSSTKIEALVYDLHALRSNKSSAKSIIFSQFTTMLQLIEWRLRRAGITTVMLDGSMTPAQRQASINSFMTDVNIECFLVSLKAGGVALNLTEASKVFIVDPWWNPAAEWQSADRCHRIGQCRPCSITRLCIEDSVESRMVLLQEKKANMINSTINADDTAMESLTPEDMQFLFRGT